MKKEISREIARQVYKGNMEIVDENIASKLDRSVSVFLSRLRRRAREREARIAIGYARNDLKYEFSSDDLRIIRNLEFFEVDPDEKTITFFYVPTIERGLSRRLRKRVAELVEKYSNYKVSFDVPARIKRARSTGWSGLTKWRVKSGKKFQVS